MLSSTIIAKVTEFYPVLRELPPGLQYALVNSCHLVQADPGKVLFDIDIPIESFLLLMEGSIRVTRITKQREFLLYRLQPGGCCIISTCHLLGNTRIQARGQVENPVSGVTIPQSLFKHIVEQSPLFSNFLFYNFADRFAELSELLDAMMSRRLDERLADLLLSKGMVIKTTHSELADELGSVREVISRILKDFKEKDVVELERGQIRILDEEALKTLARFGDSSH